MNEQFEAEPTVPPRRPVGDEFRLPPIASGRTASTDFNELYRDLDALRFESIRTEDPAILAKVSSNVQEIADLQAEADDTFTVWDQSAVERTVSDVQVFSVVDENNVLLRVDDRVEGAPVKRDNEGKKVDEGKPREPAGRTHIVWLERETGGAWFLANESWVASNFPYSPEDFDVGAELPIADKTATVLFQNDTSGTCLMVVVPETVPHPVCLYPDMPETSGMRSRVRYSLDREDGYEMIMMVSDGPLRHGIVLDGAEPVEFETDTDNGRKVGVWVAVPGQFDEAKVVPLEPGVGTPEDVVDVDLKRLRASYRRSYDGGS